MIKHVKGTKDISDTTLLQFFLGTLRHHLAQYAYQEIITSILEHAELFERSAGEHTDLVSKEMFFVQGRHAEEQATIVLRPEMTASIVRCFLQERPATPWKVFSYGPAFRYERPQKGRYREFYQVSIENIGVTSIDNDALFLTMLDRFFSEKLNLDSYALLINFLGCAEDRLSYRKLLYDFVESNAQSICDTCKDRKEKNVLRVLDCKNPDDKKLYAQAPTIHSCLCAQCADEWQRLQTVLHLMSVSYTIAPHLVRGLDYYNKTVFEFVDLSTSLGSQNTFAAGGRYDSLARQIGSSEDYPSLGAAMGVDRILLLLESMGDRIATPQKPLHVVLPLGDDEKTLGLQIVDLLHAQGMNADIMLDGGSLKSMMRRADKMQATTALIIGSDERNEHSVKVKNLKTGSDERVQQIELVAYLEKI